MVLFLSVLTIFAQIILLVILLAIALRSPAANSLLEKLRRHGQLLIMILTSTAMFGSLYFSEVLNFIPCSLCWYQRILIYPLVIISALALIRKDKTIWPYQLALLIPALGIAVYHYLVEWFDNLALGSVCDPQNPCTLRWFLEFGYISIPMMTITVTVLSILIILISYDKK